MKRIFFSFCLTFVISVLCVSPSWAMGMFKKHSHGDGITSSNFNSPSHLNNPIYSPSDPSQGSSPDPTDNSPMNTAAVPEPITLSLMSAGLVAIYLKQRVR